METLQKLKLPVSIMWKNEKTKIVCRVVDVLFHILINMYIQKKTTTMIKVMKGPKNPNFNENHKVLVRLNLTFVFEKKFLNVTFNISACRGY